ncbi:MAG: hypothetical protein ACP5QG_03785 [candidate division WOR-3 bacterium]
MKNRGNLLLIVLFFALLSFAMWRFWSVKEELLVTKVTENMYFLQGKLEEFKTLAGAYPVDLTMTVGEAVDTLLSDYSVAGEMDANGMENPFGGDALLVLPVGSEPPGEAIPGLVVYVPQDTLPGGKLARSYRITGYNRSGRRLGLSLSPPGAPGEAVPVER